MEKLSSIDTLYHMYNNVDLIVFTDRLREDIDMYKETISYNDSFNVGVKNVVVHIDFSAMGFKSPSGDNDVDVMIIELTTSYYLEAIHDREDIIDNVLMHIMDANPESINNLVSTEYVSTRIDTITNFLDTKLISNDYSFIMLLGWDIRLKDNLIGYFILSK